MSKVLKSAIAKKAVMAATGIVLFGFVVGHLAGNLKLYQGAEKINTYAEWLREIGSPAVPHGGVLWLARAVLLLAVALHIWSATTLTIANRRARPLAYDRRENVQASYASRTMVWGGVIVALYVVYHLAHLTWGWQWAHHDFIPGDVYHNVVSGFRVWWVSLFYIVAQLALGFHLHHGLWSMFQSLGWGGHAADPWRRWFATTAATAITVGNVSFPIAVMTGVIQ